MNLLFRHLLQNQASMNASWMCWGKWLTHSSSRSAFHKWLEKSREKTGSQQRSKESCAIKWSMFFKNTAGGIHLEFISLLHLDQWSSYWKDLAPRKTLRNPVCHPQTVLFCSFPVTSARHRPASSGFRCGMSLEWELIWATITLIGWMFKNISVMALEAVLESGASHCGICQFEEEEGISGWKRIAIFNEVFLLKLRKCHLCELTGETQVKINEGLLYIFFLKKGSLYYF